MKYRITIPEPCHEDWGKMTPTEKGRFCAACQKNLVDYTGYSTSELLKELVKGDTICGRLKPEQLGVALSETKIKRGFSFRVILGAMLASVGTQDAIAFHKPKPAAILGIEKNANSHKPPTFDQPSTKVAGRVHDAESGMALEDVIIYCVDANVNSQTDSLGNFEIVIPGSIPSKGLRIRASIIGYSTSELIVKKGDNQVNFLLKQLDPIEVVASKPTIEVGITGLIVVEESGDNHQAKYSKRESKSTLWQRIGTWFRGVF
jgi:hypothetical protein